MWGNLITIEEQLVVFEARLKHVEKNLAVLEARWNRPNSLPCPLPEDAFIQTDNRNILGLEYGIRGFQFEQEWVKGTIRKLRKALE